MNYGYPASQLKLYLAREGGTWMKSQDAAIQALKAKQTPDRIRNLMQGHLVLDETLGLNESAYFGNTLERVSGDIHVLVECPDEPDQVDRYKQQGGFDDSTMDKWLSWYLPWSSVQALFIANKEKRA